MSVIASALKHMLAAGMPHEAIVAAVAEMEANAAPVRSAGAVRQQRYRERNKASQTVTGDVCDGSDATPSPKEIPPTPPKEITPSPETANAVPLRKRATRLTLDWQLPKAWGDEAVAEGLSPEEVRSQAETMRDWSLSAPNGAKLDWHAAWRIWFRKAIKDRPQGRASPPPKASSSSALADSAARLVQSMRSENEIRSRSGGSGVPALIPHLPVR